MCIVQPEAVSTSAHSIIFAAQLKRTRKSSCYNFKNKQEIANWKHWWYYTRLSSIHCRLFKAELNSSQLLFHFRK